MNKKSYTKEDMRKKVLQNARENVAKENARKMGKMGGLKGLADKKMTPVDPIGASLKATIEQGKKLVNRLSKKYK